uniref:Uncharacterized protein n=1 Tax=Oryza sativa subsp. japonica TaxID=39947 RepID=Q2QU72_ORYSJ|nr:hypothetical protein LOC_Os12g17250 [Oryza sativa Japonica Group]
MKHQSAAASMWPHIHQSALRTSAAVAKLSGVPEGANTPLSDTPPPLVLYVTRLGRQQTLRESATAADSAASASARNAGTAASRASSAARDSEVEASAAARASSSDAEIHGIFLWCPGRGRGRHSHSRSQNTTPSKLCDVDRAATGPVRIRVEVARAG